MPGGFMEERKVKYNIRLGSSDWIEDILSNLKHKMFFVFGRSFFSVEGPLQAVKYDFQDARRLVAQELSGVSAKWAGKDAKKKYVYLFDGKRYLYRSPEHMAFIEILIREKVYQNSDVFVALMLTGDADIVHDLGYPDSPTTSLRKEEFAGILLKIREESKGILEEYLRMIEFDDKENIQRASLKLDRMRIEQAEKARKKYILKIG